MSKRRKLSRPGFGPESGQGTVEYILVLVVVVIILLTFMYNFNTSFRNYAEAFFDGYIGCLLDTGELPGVGAECQGSFSAYDGSSGKNLLKDNLPSGDGSGGKNGGKDAAAKDAKNDDKKGRGGGETVGGSGGRPTVGRFDTSGRGGQQDVGKLEGSEKSEGGMQADSLLGASNTSSVGRTSETYRPQTVPMTFQMQSAEEDKPDVRPSSVTAGAKADGGDSLRPSKGLENLNRGPAYKSEEKDRNFSISEFVRFMLILLIIVAMVIFFGGQLMQISRGRDKGGGD